MSVEVTRLSSGLCVVTDAMAHLQTASLGIWVGAGSRDDRPAWPAEPPGPEHAASPRDHAASPRDHAGLGGGRSLIDGEHVHDWSLPDLIAPVAALRPKTMKDAPTISWSRPVWQNDI